MRFTDKGIRSLKARKKRYEVVEDGATGLAVRVSSRGTRTFSYLYRYGGKPKRLSLGIYRDASLEPLGLPSDRDQRGLPYLTLADARVALAAAKRLRDGGIDPSAKALAERQQERKAETVGELIDGFLARYVGPNKKASSAAEDKRQLEADVRPAWGSKKVTAIRRADVTKLLNAVVERGSPKAANRLLAVVRKMLKWAVGQGIIETSPASDFELPGGKESTRDRVLAPSELIEIWEASLQLGAPYGQLVRLLMITGQRRGEVAGLRNTEMEMAAKLWTVPAVRMKNSLPHEVPLTSLALDEIKTLLKMLPEEMDCLLRSGRRGDQPIREFKGAKKQLDALILQARREWLKKAGRDPEKASPMPKWVLHDLRRTMRTSLAAMRQDPEICERVLAHVPAGVRRNYDKHAYRDEKREVLQVWASRLKRIIKAKAPASGNVIRLKAASAE